MRVVGCFVEYDGKFVVLLRHSHKPEGNTWGLPSGKVEVGESDEAAILRELTEETGYRATADELEHIGDYDFISSDNKPYTYVTYKLLLSRRHNIKLETAAHAAYDWVSAKECYAKSDLISSFHDLLKLVGYIK